MRAPSVEVAIVGGGPAGLSTALFLLSAEPRLAGRVAVLEKERFPREKFCAGGLGARADALLGSIGAVVDVPSVPIDAIAFRAMGRTVVAREPGLGRVIRRVEFDHELARVARGRGVQIREGVRVTALRRAGHGFELESAQGPITARIVVGADGVQSVVRRGFGFGNGRLRAQAIEVDTEPVDSDLPRDVLVFDANRRDLAGYYWDFPTLVDGRPMVVRGVYQLRVANGERRLEIQDVLAEELASRGLSLASYRKKRFAELAFDPHQPASRPGVLLVGEAAGIDPVTGEGIAQAIQYGAVAGRYLARKLTERELSFEDYESEIWRTMIGRDLLARSLGVPLFYGPPRAHVERFLLETPDFIRVGAQHFAGKRWSRGRLAHAGWRALVHTGRYLLGRPAEDPSESPASPAEN